jgi:hypothetical protein
VWQRTGNKKIRGGLPIGWLVPKIDEVLPGLISTTEVGHPALVDHTHFVEVLV